MRLKALALLVFVLSAAAKGEELPLVSNVDYRTRASAETDFPCIYGERVGMGRSYVRQKGSLTYRNWLEGIRAGRSYVSDGKSHLRDFKANDLEVGERGSELHLARPGRVRVTALVAALLAETPGDDVRRQRYDEKPYWDLERARIGDSRQVPLEVVVNGHVVARQEIVADGALRPVAFEVPIEQSSWIALRILPSHTNPIFVLVGEKLIRASRKSAEWCLRAVDQCWSQKVSDTARKNSRKPGRPTNSPGKPTASACKVLFSNSAADGWSARQNYCILL